MAATPFVMEFGECVETLRVCVEFNKQVPTLRSAHSHYGPDPLQNPDLLTFLFDDPLELAVRAGF